jgi:hypothetical protein
MAHNERVSGITEKNYKKQKLFVGEEFCCLMYQKGTSH